MISDSMESQQNKSWGRLLPYKEQKLFCLDNCRNGLTCNQAEKTLAQT